MILRKALACYGQLLGGQVPSTKYLVGKAGKNFSVNRTEADPIALNGGLGLLFLVGLTLIEI